MIGCHNHFLYVVGWGLAGGGSGLLDWTAGGVAEVSLGPADDLVCFKIIFLLVRPLLLSGIFWRSQYCMLKLFAEQGAKCIVIYMFSTCSKVPIFQNFFPQFHFIRYFPTFHL